MPFVNRVGELAWLERGWASGTPQLKILYGRLRVGKSALADELARGKRAVVYQAVEGTVADQLADLTAAILALEPDAALRAAPLASWDAAFSHLARMAATEPLLVILDEYQLAAEADPTLASTLQHFWSDSAADLPVHLVLCCSALRFVARQLLGGLATAPNAASLRLPPFSYRESARFLPEWSPADRVRAFAVAGGVPYNQLQFDPDRPLPWNIANRIVQRGTVLYQEAELLVGEDLRERRVYYSILRALSDGLVRVSDITARVRGRGGASDLTPYLSTLQELGLVAYRQPIVGGSVRRGKWTLEDPYLRFWFRFVLPFRSRLEHGADVDAFYEAAVAPALDQFVSKPTFGEICRAWVQNQVDAGAWSGVDRVGAWWAAAPAPGAGAPSKRAEVELDIVGAMADRVIVAGQANWTRDYVGFDTLHHLREVVRCIPGADANTELVLFARDFDYRLKRRADEERVRLVSADELYA